MWSLDLAKRSLAALGLDINNINNIDTSEYTVVSSFFDTVLKESLSTTPWVFMKEMTVTNIEKSSVVDKVFNVDFSHKTSENLYYIVNIEQGSVKYVNVSDLPESLPFWFLQYFELNLSKRMASSFNSPARVLSLLQGNYVSSYNEAKFLNSVALAKRQYGEN